MTRRRRLLWLLPAALLAPALTLLLFAFVAPLVTMAVYSFYEARPGGVMIPAFTLTNYRRFLLDPFHLTILWRTLVLGAWVTAWSLVLGYPVAYTLARVRSRRLRGALVTLLLVPLMTSVVVRSYGWMILLAGNGVVNTLLVGVGLVEQPVQLLFNTTGVVIALVAILMPYMVLTLVPVIQNIDPYLEQAAQSLGASRWRVFRDVVLPLSMPGVAAGCRARLRPHHRGLRHAPPRGRQPAAGHAHLRLRPGDGSPQLAVRRRDLVHPPADRFGSPGDSGSADGTPGHWGNSL